MLRMSASFLLQAETVASWMRVIGSYNPYYAMEHNAVEAAMRRAFPGGLQGVRAVDIGCGEGRWARKLAALGADVTGFDPSRELIIQGNKTPLMAGAQGTVELFQGNVLDQSCLEGMLPAGLALSVMVLQMMDSKAQLGAMARFTAAALRPGGFMAFVYVSDEVGGRLHSILRVQEHQSSPPCTLEASMTLLTCNCCKERCWSSSSHPPPYPVAVQAR